MSSLIPAPLHEALNPYVDIPFNLYLILILTFAYFFVNHPLGRKVLLAIVIITDILIVYFDRTSTTGGIIKIQAELVGLAVVLGFLTAPRSWQVRHLRSFTTFVNFAVYGNIGMMVGTPTEQGRQARWRTITLDPSGLFIFTAVSKSWIIAHAFYRFVLLTLPVFSAGRRHRLLELYSLSMTFILSRTAKLPFEQCFGMADTLVVPAAMGWSAIASTFDLVPRDGGNANRDFISEADLFLSFVSLAAGAFACYKTVTASSRAS